MPADRNILLLFDDTDINAEVVHYAIGLAKRINTNIIMLLLLALDYDSQNEEDSDALRILELRDCGERSLAPYFEQINKENIKVRGEVRIGDPASELLKFLAEGHAIHSVVWGGDKTMMTTKKLKMGEHWMAGVKDKLRCPMVVPGGSDKKEVKICSGEKK